MGITFVNPLSRAVRVIERFPWVARIYFLLILLFSGILIWTATKQGSGVLPDTDLRVKLFNLSADGLKTVLGALIGSLSIAAESIWRKSIPLGEKFIAPGKPQDVLPSDE